MRVCMCCAGASDISGMNANGVCVRKQEIYPLGGEHHLNICASVWYVTQIYNVIWMALLYAKRIQRTHHISLMMRLAHSIRIRFFFPLLLLHFSFYLSYAVVVVVATAQKKIPYLDANLCWMLSNQNEKFLCRICIQWFWQWRRVGVAHWWAVGRYQMRQHNPFAMCVILVRYITIWMWRLTSPFFRFFFWLLFA